jgi:NADPH-ferrihemoprotein reductase
MVLAVLALQQMRKRSTAGAAAPVAGRVENGDGAGDKPVVKCLFGSQTGTAEGFAKEVAGELSKAGFHAKVVDLEDVDMEEFLQSGEREYHVYFVATYGEGDPTDNAVGFYNFLRKSAAEGGPTDSLGRQLFYSVFALGNSQYEHYNNVGKTVFRRLGEVGGTSLHPLGLGDDDKDIEEDFGTWREGLARAFARHALGEDAAAAAERADGERGSADGDAAGAAEGGSFRALFVPGPEDAVLRALEGRLEAGGLAARRQVAERLARRADLGSRHLFQGIRCAVAERRELRQSTAAGNTVHVEFDLRGSGLAYSTADNLTVLCENAPAQVAAAAAALGLDPAQWFALEPRDPAAAEELKLLMPSPCTVRAALAFFCDLNGAPSRALVARLAPFAADPAHRAALRRLASREGKEEFSRLVADPQLSVAELLAMFPSWRVGEERLGDLLEAMPRLKGRDYTIASSAAAQPARVALTVGVIREAKPARPGAAEPRELIGVCSNFLRDASAALVYVKDSSFKLPKDPKVPIIMVGPGTGIAPMRAFVQERQFQIAKLGKQRIGEAVLFFGCRRDNEDFLYKEELLAALQSGALNKLHVAFSRQQERKVYVQHLIHEQAAELWALIGKGAHVYVCGATKMGKDVHLAFVDLCKRAGGLDLDAAKAHVAALQASGRYVQELWSSS